MQNAAAICNPEMLSHFAAIKISLPGMSSCSPESRKGLFMSANINCRTFFERKINTLQYFIPIKDHPLFFSPAEVWDSEHSISQDRGIDSAGRNKTEELVTL